MPHVAVLVILVSCWSLDKNPVLQLYKNPHAALISLFMRRNFWAARCGKKHPPPGTIPVGSTFNIQNSIPHKSQKTKVVSEMNRAKEFQRGTAGVLESAKEGVAGLSEGSDIGLGARCREFESPISDHRPWNRTISGSVFLFKYTLLWTVKILAHFWILVRRFSFSRKIQRNLAHPQEFSGHA